MKRLLALAAVAIMAGCGGNHPLAQRYAPDRAQFGDKPLPVPPPPVRPAPPRVDIVNPDPAAPAGAALPSPDPDPAETITGTWTFITPPTATRVEQKTAQFSRYYLYSGQPAPTDTPFLVITVSKDPRSVAESDPNNFKITNQRDYAYNGNIIHEWTGNTRTGAGFSELLIKKPAGSPGADVCHAMAVAKSPAERDVALSILNSITWKAEP